MKASTHSSHAAARPMIQAVVLFLCFLLVLLPLAGCINSESDPIRIGILHSLSGTMADSESPLVDAALVAIEELNESGGVLGRRIEPVIADGKSDGGIFAAEATRLITEEQVSAVFGVWTSAHRKAVRGVFETHDSLLFYPLQYEGLEQSPNIVYLGATPNQQIIPAVEWSYRFLGPRMFLVGSDYVFPRIANTIIRDELGEFGVEPVGEEYVVLGGTDFGEIVQKVIATKPDVIFNTVNGDSNRALFDALREAGISSDTVPVMSVSIGESELQGLGIETLAGNYSAWSYFQSIDASVNRKFLRLFGASHGVDSVVGDPMEATYTGIHLWAGAVESSGSIEPTDVKSALRGKTYSAAKGIVRVDSVNQHLWQAARIGRLQQDGQFDIVWESDVLPPVNFPVSRERTEWAELLDKMYQSWGGNWANPNAN